ncbi:MAG: hypothetical protein IJ228_09705 [Succinivibrio sp.]|nr:hypothetical protein [Succinivibrio sp.]
MSDGSYDAGRLFKDRYMLNLRNRELYLRSGYAQGEPPYHDIELACAVTAWQLVELVSAVRGHLKPGCGKDALLLALLKDRVIKEFVKSQCALATLSLQVANLSPDFHLASGAAQEGLRRGSERGYNPDGDLHKLLERNPHSPAIEALIGPFNLPAQDQVEGDQPLSEYRRRGVYLWQKATELGFSYGADPEGTQLG